MIAVLTARGVHMHACTYPDTCLCDQDAWAGTHGLDGLACRPVGACCLTLRGVARLALAVMPLAAWTMCG